MKPGGLKTLHLNNKTKANVEAKQNAHLCTRAEKDYTKIKVLCLVTTTQTNHRAVLLARDQQTKALWPTTSHYMSL
jgi:ribosomal 50S subunit-recycling heat shock protein